MACLNAFEAMRSALEAYGKCTPRREEVKGSEMMRVNGVTAVTRVNNSPYHLDKYPVI
jgi:hypothetical protein